MDKDQLIQKYLKKQLLPEEKEVFDTLLKNDTSFREEVDFQVNLSSVIRLEERETLKEELQSLDNSQKRISFSKWMVAAGFSILILAGGYFYFEKNALSHQELFAQNFTPATNVLHPVVRGEDSLTQIEKSFVYYENGDFDQFIKSLTSTPYTNPDYDFFLANAYLAQGKSTQAITILKKYLTQEKGTFKAKAHWFLGLAYLKEKQISQAKEQFEVLKNYPDFNYKQVIKVLNKIN